MNLVADTVAALAAAAGLVVSVVTLLAATRESRRARRTAEGLARLQADKAIEASDIDELGSLLHGDLGQVAIADYVSDEKIQLRFRDTMTRVLQYLEPPADSSEIDRVRTEHEDTPSSSSVLTSTLREAEDEILSGKVWNGLARMRREFEIALRNILGPAPDRTLRSLPAMWRELIRLEVLPEDAERDLRYATYVAGNAIHGREVSQSEAMEALSIVDRVLQYIYDHRERTVGGSSP
jgi:hypothetical protein